MKQLLNDFANYLDFLSPRSKKSYLWYVKRVDRENKGETLQWLKDAATNADPLGDLSKKFDDFFNPIQKLSKKTKSNLKTGLLTLGKFVFGFNESSINLQSIKNFDLVACQLIAQTAIFCPVHVFEAVVNGKCGSKDNQSSNGNAFGSWFNCKYQRAKKGLKRGNITKDPILGDITLDDNTKANYAIKKAVLEGLKKYGIHNADIDIFKGFEACHIWADTCYNPRYHTSVANLVLIPREIAGLTDHCDAVKELLKYESFKRFGFLPNVDNNGVIIQMQQPVQPNIYNSLTWRTTPTP